MPAYHNSAVGTLLTHLATPEVKQESLKLNEKPEEVITGTNIIRVSKGRAFPTRISKAQEDNIQMDAVDLLSVVGDLSE